MVKTSLIPTVSIQARTVRAGGRDWCISSAQDEAALLALVGLRDPFPLGLQLWEGAIALADVMAERHRGSQDLRDLRVLELGCGVGLAGLCAAHFGATVTMTDHDPIALNAAELNAHENGMAAIAFRMADWSDWADRATYDVILGADILYDRTAHGPILDILSGNLAHGGVALFADPGRYQQAAFLEAAATSGFVASAHVRQVDDLKRTGHTVAVTIIQLTRPFAIEVAEVAHSRG